MCPCDTVSRMQPLTVCVLAKPEDGTLRLLDAAPEGVRFVVGTSPGDFAAAAPEADVICLVSGGRALLEPVFLRAARARWVHIGWAGLDGALFPGLIDSPVPVTNARGVFISFAQRVRARRDPVLRQGPAADAGQPGGGALGAIRGGRDRRPQRRDPRFRRHRPRCRRAREGDGDARARDAPRHERLAGTTRSWTRASCRSAASS